MHEIEIIPRYVPDTIASMESLDFLYRLKDAEGFDGRPVPPRPPSPPPYRPTRLQVSVAVAALLLTVALVSIGRDLRRERLASRTVAARN